MSKFTAPISIISLFFLIACSQASFNADSGSSLLGKSGAAGEIPVSPNPVPPSPGDPCRIDPATGAVVKNSGKNGTSSDSESVSDDADSSSDDLSNSSDDSSSESKTAVCADDACTALKCQ